MRPSYTYEFLCTVAFRSRLLQYVITIHVCLARMPNMEKHYAEPLLLSPLQLASLWSDKLARPVNRPVTGPPLLVLRASTQLLYHPNSDEIASKCRESGERVKLLWRTDANNSDCESIASLFLPPLQDLFSPALIAMHRLGAYNPSFVIGSMRACSDLLRDFTLDTERVDNRKIMGPIHGFCSGRKRAEGQTLLLVTLRLSPWNFCPSSGWRGDWSDLKHVLDQGALRSRPLLAVYTCGRRSGRRHQSLWEIHSSATSTANCISFQLRGVVPIAGFNTPPFQAMRLGLMWPPRDLWYQVAETRSREERILRNFSQKRELADVTRDGEQNTQVRSPPRQWPQPHTYKIRADGPGDLRLYRNPYAGVGTAFELWALFDYKTSAIAPLNVHINQHGHLERAQLVLRGGAIYGLPFRLRGSKSRSAWHKNLGIVRFLGLRQALVAFTVHPHTLFFFEWPADGRLAPLWLPFSSSIPAGISSNRFLPFLSADPRSTYSDDAAPGVGLPSALRGSYCCSLRTVILSVLSHASGNIGIHSRVPAFLGVAHLKQEPFAYLHHFYAVRSTSPFDILTFSSPFCIEASGRFSMNASEVRQDGCERIQFISGLQVFDQEVVVSYGINDCEAALLRVPLRTVTAMLEPPPSSPSTPLTNPSRSSFRQEVLKNDLSGAFFRRLFLPHHPLPQLRPSLLLGRRYSPGTQLCLVRAARRRQIVARRLLVGHNIIGPPLKARSSVWRYPTDAVAHYNELLRATEPFRRLSSFSYRGYSGPWVENLWIDRFCCDPLPVDGSVGQEILWRFGEFIPLFVQWMDLRLADENELRQRKRESLRQRSEKSDTAHEQEHQNKGKISSAADRYLELMHRLRMLLRPDVVYITVSQHDAGLPAGLLPPDLLPNVLVLSAGGFGHVAIPNLLRELQPDFVTSPSPDDGAQGPNARGSFSVWFVGTIHSFRSVWLSALNVALSRVGLGSVQTLRVRAGDPAWRNRLKSASVCLAPRGMGRSSFTTYEAIQVGCVPVVLYDDIAWLPYREDLWELLPKEKEKVRDHAPNNTTRVSIGFAARADAHGFAALAQQLAKLAGDPVLLDAMKMRLKAMRETHFTYAGVLLQIEKFMLATAPAIALSVNTSSETRKGSSSSATSSRREVIASTTADLRCHTSPPIYPSMRGPAA